MHTELFRQLAGGGIFIRLRHTHRASEHPVQLARKKLHTVWAAMYENPPLNVTAHDRRYPMQPSPTDRLPPLHHTKDLVMLVNALNLFAHAGHDGRGNRQSSPTPAGLTRETSPAPRRTARTDRPDESMDNSLRLFTLGGRQLRADLGGRVPVLAIGGMEWSIFLARSQRFRSVGIPLTARSRSPRMSSSRLPTSYTFERMADEIFEHPRLAAIYDQLDPDRSDLHAYLHLAQQLNARRVLDIGCGTGVFALLLADHGIEVVGVDPAQASVKVARSKPGSDRVRWICGDATDLPPLQVDLVTMTANVAQAIVAPHMWQRSLQGAYEALRPGGHLAFETRDPAKRAWETWNRAASHRVTDIPGVGTVESWVELVEVSGPLVTFRWNYVFAADGQQLTSDSTLRFRERQEIESDLIAQGYALQEVRDAPERPGKEFVFVAQRS